MQQTLAALDWVSLVDAIFKLLLLPIAVAAVVYLAKLSGFKLSDQQTEDLKQSVRTGLLKAEEDALQAWKNHGVATPGPEKLQAAVTTAREVSKDGLQQHSDQQLKAIAAGELVTLRPLLSSPPPPIPSTPPPAP